VSHTPYLQKSWFDPRLEKRASPIHGTGIFATHLIHAGERLVIPGGIVFSTAEWTAGKVPLDPSRAYNEVQIDDDLFLAMPIDEDLNYYFNHSCDPNFWGNVARRAIQEGEEITTDYALGIVHEGYCLDPCRCGSALCRQRVTGNDWTLPELQRRYHGQFAPFVERWIQARGQNG
jgi:hypothetical protein